MDGAPPWEETPPPPDAPPWEEDRPPLPDAPPWEEEPPQAPPKAAPRPAPGERPDAPLPPAAGSAGIWQELVEQYKNKLTPMYWFMLDDARGSLEGDVLTVACGDELTQESLNCPEVIAVIGEITGARLGRPVTVRFTLRAGDAPAEDKLEELIRQGSRFDSFTVK